MRRETGMKTPGKGIWKAIAVLAAMTVLLCGWTAAAEESEGDRDYRINDGNKKTFLRLFDQLRTACAAHSEGDGERIDALVKEIAETDADDGDVARAIAEHWKKVYLDPDYQLCVYGGGQKAEELEATEPDYAKRHAFVVLGYELKNGKMQDELKGRCDAAAAAARSFPGAYLICSGGATGPGNLDRNTEAGEMKRYLIGECGINKKRILTDTRAKTTLANAENTFEILRKKKIHSITIVTSTYHQRWGQVLYNALAAVYEKRCGFTVRIVGDYSYETEPANETLRQGYQIALSQLSEMLGLKKRTQ